MLESKETINVEKLLLESKVSFHKCASYNMATAEQELKIYSSYAAMLKIDRPSPLNIILQSETFSPNFTYLLWTLILSAASIALLVVSDK